MNTKIRKVAAFSVQTQTAHCSKMKHVFVAWSQSVTYHCYPKIFKEKTHFLARIAWTLVFACFTLLTCLILTNNMMAYFEYSVVSTILVVNERPTLFPTITICDSNIFTTKQAESVIKGTFGNSQFETVYSAIPYVKMVVNNPDYGDEKRQLLGFNLSDLIITCTFNEASCDFDNDFHWVFHYNYGNCFQFNSGLNMRNEPVKVKQAAIEGQIFGLILELGPVLNQNEIATINARGLKVFVHNQTATTPGYFDTALSLEPGKETNIVIDRIFTSNVPYPYSDCAYLSSGAAFFHQFVAKSNKSYRQTECFYSFFQKSISEICDCYFTGFPKLDDHSKLPPCLNSTQYKCFTEAYYAFVRDIKAVTSKYSSECPLECERVTYGLQVSSMEYFNIDLYNEQKNSILNKTQAKYDIDASTYETFRKHFYALNFFYPVTQYTLITESPRITLVSLLSSLGGSLGMFLGFSLFSIVEVVELIVKILVALCKKSF